MRKVVKKVTCVAVLFSMLLGIYGCQKNNALTEGSITDDDTSQENTAEEVDGKIDENILFALYEDYLEQEADKLLQYDQGKYGYYDINKDGIKELIIKELDALHVIAYVDEQLEVIYSGNYSTLLANGMIQYYQPYPPNNKKEDGGADRYEFYQYDNGSYIMEAEFWRYFGDVEDKGSYGNYYGEDDVYYENTPDTNNRAIEVQMWEWMDELEEYTKLPSAKIEFQNLDRENSKLSYGTETEAYEAFLSGKCSLTVSNFDETAITKLSLREGQEYCLYDILNRLRNEIYEGDDYLQNNFGIDVSYAYIDCENDGSKELALQFSTYIGMDENITTYVINYEDSQLQLCYGMDAWSRSRRTMNQYGYVWADGSGGAAHSLGEEYAVRENGTVLPVLEWEWADIYGGFLYDYKTALKLYEIRDSWYDNNDGSLSGLGFCLYVMGDDEYLQYAYNETSDNKEDFLNFIQSCEEAGIHFYSDKEINDLIAQRREELNVTDLAKDENEIEWVALTLPQE